MKKQRRVMGSAEQLFVTQLYRTELFGARRLNPDLSRTCLGIAQDDRAGQRWAKKHGYRGYTSYASLDDLETRASVFQGLSSAIFPHVTAFARKLFFDLAGGRMALDSIWINVLESGGVHPAHIHPQAAISGTYYVAVPRGAGAIRFEDPRLSRMMAAPARRADAPRRFQPFVTVSPKPGTLLLWESWLRHDVPVNESEGTRISVSFNYAIR